MSEAATPPDSSGQKSLKGKLLLPVFALMNLVVLGGGAFLVYSGTLGYQHPFVREPAAFEALRESRKAAELGSSVLYTMPSFTVNLSGTPRRLVRIEMALEMLDKEGFEEVVRNSPAARDQVVRILNRKTFDDIETIQGKLFLKDQIAVALNQALKKGVVKDIYFSEFLVQ